MDRDRRLMTLEPTYIWRVSPATERSGCHLHDRREQGRYSGAVNSGNKSYPIRGTVILAADLRAVADKREISAGRQDMEDALGVQNDQGQIRRGDIAGVEQELIKLEDAGSRLLLKSDVAYCDRILADNYTETMTRLRFDQGPTPRTTSSPAIPSALLRYSRIAKSAVYGYWRSYGPVYRKAQYNGQGFQRSVSNGPTRGSDAMDAGNASPRTVRRSRRSDPTDFWAEACSRPKTAERGRH